MKSLIVIKQPRTIAFFLGRSKNTFNRLCAIKHVKENYSLDDNLGVGIQYTAYCVMPVNNNNYYYCRSYSKYTQTQ